jgi:hypothetical protein
MKLLTKEIINKLPALYSQEHNEDPNVVVKFFTPDSSFTWFVIEGEEQEDGDWLFFNKCYSHLCPEGELGYVMLSQLQEVRGGLGLPIERDKWFSPKPLSQIKNGS